MVDNLPRKVVLQTEANSKKDFPDVNQDKILHLKKKKKKKT